MFLSAIYLNACGQRMLCTVITCWTFTWKSNANNQSQCMCGHLTAMWCGARWIIRSTSSIDNFHTGQV